MNVGDLNSRVAVVNAEIKRLNNERQVNIGRKETLNVQLKNALDSYEHTYGVKLDIDSVESEISKVTAEVEADTLHMERILTLIGEGKYAEAEQLIGGIINPQDGTAVQSVQPSEPVSQPAEVQSTPVMPSVPTETSVMPDVPMGTPPTQPSTPVPPIPEPAVSRPSIPAPPVDTSEDVEGSVPPIAPPPGFGGDGFVTGAPISSFSQILSGTPFNPQGGN